MENKPSIELRKEKLETIIDWAKSNKDISTVLLTSSLVNPLASIDEFSDLDIELVFDDNTKYISSNDWVHHFGNPIAMIEENESYFDDKYAMKMVLYDDYVKVDFKMYSTPCFLEEVNQNELSEDWDIGYKVLIDKNGITKEMKEPTHQVSIIKKPTEQKFKQILNDFWWDTTYVAKCLARDEIFYAKFMSENNIRTDYLIPLIEWYIANQHDWNITTNKYGRLFKKYLTPEIWEKVEQTFSGKNKNENWNALFAIADLVSEIGTDLSEKLGYEYPVKLETDIRQYLNAIQKRQ